MISPKWLCAVFFLLYTPYSLPFRKIVGNHDQHAVLYDARTNDQVSQLFNDIVHIQDRIYSPSAIEEINKANKRHLIYAISLPIVIFLSIIPWLI